MSATSIDPGFRLCGWHVLAMVVGFFGVVIAVDTGFVIMAYRTFPGEVSSTPYEDGVAYNRTLAQLGAQKRLGWRTAAAAGPGGLLRVEVRDRTGAPVRGLRLVARLERPATESGRIAPVFHEQAPGDYLANPGRLTGAWDLTVQLHDASALRFTAERRLSWP